MRQLDAVRKFSATKFAESLEAAREQFAGDRGGLESLEIVGRRSAAREGERDPSRAIEVLAGRESPGSLASEQDHEMHGTLEAIILDRLRPPYLILRDEIAIRGEYDHVELIEANKPELEAISKSVGRVDLFHHRTLNFAGTAWMIDDDIAVTNRHVAQVFAEEDWTGGYRFRTGAFGEQIEARVDYVRQHDGGRARRRADVVEVLYIAGRGEPDIAFLKVEPLDATEPLQLFAGRVREGQPVAAVGYPASDGGRNDPGLMQELFEGIYDVKRFAPGLVTGHESNDVIVLGDYTSLGGNSGSPVLDLETGQAVALHFAGAFRDSNYAVASDIVAAARARIKTQISVPDIEEEAPTSKSEQFAGRDGYVAEFLGSGELSVPLPGLGPWADDIAPVSDDDDNILKYRHFSVIQSASRRLPILTAVNIDGARAVRLKRKGTWRLDGRLKLEHQIGNELYRRNPLDRGHMVRRMDPGWGDSVEEAQEAEIDTFHYTNSAPQHKDLNQKDWVGLEDYILEAADTRDFKVNVFTGPIYRDDDRKLRHQPGAEDVPIPQEFWKVASMVNVDTGKLSATGYILSHGPMIRNLTEAAFVLGQYETYQVRIALIEAETGLDFGDLRSADPMGAELTAESAFAETARKIGGPQDLML